MTQLSEVVILDALLREELSAFIAKVFATVSPSDIYLSNWHIDLIADHLMKCYRGDIKRLIITMPPRSLKSICTSVSFPTWVLGNDPTARIICSSYGYELSCKFARDCKIVMDSDWYQRVFPWTRLLRKVELDLETTRKGGRYATSIGGSLTGRGGNIIIIDDPMKPDESHSVVSRNSVKKWYDGTLYSRLDSKADGVIIIVMQRLHVDDLVAHVMEKEEWIHLDLPAIAETNQVFTLGDGRYFERREGEILHLAREPLQVLNKIKKTIGDYNFTAQYQQRPVPEEGNLIKWKWFRYFDKSPFDNGEYEIVQSWDTASKTTDLSHYSVCTTWLIKNQDYYLLDLFRDKLDYPALRNALIDQSLRFPTKVILIEDTSAGMALIQEIRQNQISDVPYPIAIKPVGDKVERIASVSLKIEAGHVFLPRHAPWLDDFQAEILQFPHGRFDDQVDSMSQFLTWIIGRKICLPLSHP